jgi:hypothetical protein
MTTSSVLFIRSVPSPVAIAALRWIRGQFPGAAVTVLTSDGGRRALEQAGIAASFEPYTTPRLGVASAGPTLVRHLAERRFDVVIVPYAGDRSDYWNVARLGLGVRGRSTAWMACDRLTGNAEAHDVLVPVSLADWWREAHSVSRIRLALLGVVKWVALIGGYVVAMGALVALAALLLPLVWLKPGPARPE